MTNATLLPAPGSHISNASVLSMVLADRLAHRGWQFLECHSSVMVGRPEWPSQLTVLVREAESDAPAIFGLAIDLGTMPLRGERFRDVFNSEREEILRGYGNFTLRQVGADGSWLKPVSGQAFTQGMTDGLSRKAQLAVFDRSSDEGGSLADRFVTASNRLVETGNEIGSVLQRLYQRTVLRAPETQVPLPDLVRPSLGQSLAAPDEASYPWRR